MKAFTVKFLPCTNTLPARLKVSFPQHESMTFYENSFSYAGADNQEIQAVQMFIKERGLRFESLCLCAGQLENGNYVVTLTCGLNNLVKAVI